MGVRKFRIINKAGQIFDLSGNIAKLTDPTGLGLIIFIKKARQHLNKAK